jgi:hypothetical protein
MGSVPNFLLSNYLTMAILCFQGMKNERGVWYQLGGKLASGFTGYPGDRRSRKLGNSSGRFSL